MRFRKLHERHINSKNISKFLVLSIILSGIPMCSFADTTYTEEVYEMFEGSNIQISDIMDEHDFDIEIQGNTLVNIANEIDKKETKNLFDLEWLKENWDNQEKSSNANVSYISKPIKLKPNTTYIVSSNCFQWSTNTTVPTFTAGLFMSTDKNTAPSSLVNGLYQDGLSITTDDTGYLYLMVRDVGTNLILPKLNDFINNKYWITIIEDVYENSENLFDLEWLKESWNQQDVSPNLLANYISEPIKLKPNTTYIVSSNCNGSTPNNINYRYSSLFISKDKNTAPSSSVNGLYEEGFIITTNDTGYLYLMTRAQNEGLIVPELDDFINNKYWIRITDLTSAIDLEYLYPNTKYQIQFNSDANFITDITLGGTKLSNQNIVNGLNKIYITTSSVITDNTLSFSNSEHSISDIVVTDSDEEFKYFNGIKSVGEVEGKIEIASKTNNLINELVEGMFNVGTGKFQDREGCIRTNLISVKPNTTYTISTDLETKYNIRVCYFGENHSYLSKNELFFGEGTFTTPSNCYYVTAQTDPGVFDENYPLQLEEGSIATQYSAYGNNVFEIPLEEPLRGVPNGAKDKLVRKNNKWYIQRNCGEVVLDGSSDEKWEYVDNNNGKTAQFNVFANKAKLTVKGSANLVCDKFGYDKENSSGNGVEGILINSSNQIKFELLKSRFKNLSTFKQWLSENPITVVYELETPIYESLNINHDIYLYQGTTYITANSVIPIKLKIMINRTINLAIKYLLIAKENPTVKNISQVRYWINLLEDSTLKDQLQDEISKITEVEDLEIEKKTVTASMNLYIKSENSLSMSLNTNSIIFDNYSGVEDVEKLKALELTISSSLPYNINAYLESDISNADKSKLLDKELFNIKNDTDTIYKQFADINEKLVLKEDCESGNSKKHNIDLMLEGGYAHVADVYNTTIKIEVEQK